MTETIDFELVLTAIAAAAGAVAVGWLIWLENRPRQVGAPRLLPTTALLFLCVLVVILALAHLVSLVSGTPHVGRFG